MFNSNFYFNTNAGGKRIGDSGYLVEPAVFADVKDDMSIATDEIFGPVQVRRKHRKQFA